MHELFDHTADLGLRAKAADLNTLFSEAASCLYSAIFDNPDAIEAKVSRTIEIAGEDLAYLMFDWLKELLYQFDCDAIAYSRFSVDVQPNGLTATVWGEQIDTKRHFLTREVKAITYHDLTVEKTNEGWLTEIIVDI